MNLVNISIITVAYNSSSFLELYFRSIEKQKFSNWQIVIVDSGSTDNTLTKIENLTAKYRNKVKLIKSKNNLGFATGCNLAIDKADGKYLFFLNPDTKLENNCLSALWNKAESLKNKDFFLIPRQKNYSTKKFVLDGVCVDIFGYPYKIFDAENPQKTKPPFFCDGAALFIPKETFVKLGKFDETMFMINEDIDLSWKAHLCKIALINVSKAIIYHFSGGSMKGGNRKSKIYVTTYTRRYLGERNAIRNIFKNYSFATLVWLVPLYFLINCFEVFIFFFSFEYKASWQYIKAWGWNIRNFQTVLAKRNWIQQKRLITDKELLDKMYRGSGKLNAFIHIKVPRFE